MAAAYIGSESLLMCAVCLESMLERRPTALSCLHTFCLQCLEKVAADEKNITCPTCRKQTDIPTGGLQELPENFMLKQLGGVEEKCQLCDGTEAGAVCFHCSDCNVNFCKNCLKSHMDCWITWDHKISPLSKKTGENCKSHKLPMTYWCPKCEVALCVNCLSQDVHKDHSSMITKRTTTNEVYQKQYCEQVLLLAEAKTEAVVSFKNMVKDIGRNIKAHTNTLHEQIEEKVTKLNIKLGLSWVGKNKKDELLNKLSNLTDELKFVLKSNNSVEMKRMSEKSLNVLQSDHFALGDLPYFEPCQVEVTIGEVYSEANSGDINKISQTYKLIHKETKQGFPENIPIQNPKDADEIALDHGWKVQKGPSFSSLELYINAKVFHFTQSVSTGSYINNPICDVQFSENVGCITFGKFKALANGGILICDGSRPWFIILEGTGSTIAIVSLPDQTGGVKDVDIYQEYIFIYHNDSIYRFNLHEEKMSCIETYVNLEFPKQFIAATSETNVLLISGDFIFKLFLEGENAGYIERYSSELKGASCVCYLESDKKELIGVHCYKSEDYWANFVEFLDKHGGSTGKKLYNSPCCGIKQQITPMGTFLFVNDKQAMTEYKFFDSKIRGIDFGQKILDVSFNYPFAWIKVKDDVEMIRRYSIFCTVH